MNTDAFTTKIPIYHNDGTKLAVAKGAQLHVTNEGEKAGVKMRHLPDGTVCEIGGNPAFEIRHKGAAAISITAELFTYDGAFLKWSEVSLSGLLTIAPGKPLQLGGCTFKDCHFQAEVEIQIGEPKVRLPTAVVFGFAAPGA